MKKTLYNWLIVIIIIFSISCEKDKNDVEISIKLNKTLLTILPGDEASLAVTVIPNTVANKSVIWNSSNPEVATVDANGKIIALESGISIITATTTISNKTAMCNVTVSNQAIKIRLLDYSGDTIIVADTTNYIRSVLKNNDGTFHMPLCTDILKSITMTGCSPVMIGRKTNTNMTFKTNDTAFILRVPQNGYIPIGSYAEFRLMSNSSSSDKKFKLEASIDFMNIKWETQGLFNGELDGSQYSISNLKIEQSEAGLFYSNLGYIHDFGIASGHLKGINMAGGICCVNMGLINKCYNGSTLNGFDHVGGICSKNEMIISNSYNSGTINATGYYVGGICGYSGNSEYSTDASITRCYNIGNIKGKRFTGGMCGYNQGTVSACYNTASVTGSENNIGGICGYSRVFEMLACYNSGNIKGDSYVGGICGETSAGSDITACYNIGSITGNYYVGGVNGKNTTKITACYNIAEIYGNGFTGGICGETDTSIDDIASCFWKNVDGDNADYGIGSFYTDVPNVKLFDSHNWPNSTDNREWGVGNGSTRGTYWKNLGNWDVINAVYPKLWFEN